MMKFVILLAVLIATALAAPQPQVYYTPAVTYTNDGTSATYRVTPTPTPIRTVGYVQQPTYVYGATEAQSGQYIYEPITYIA